MFLSIIYKFIELKVDNVIRNHFGICTYTHNFEFK